MNFALSVIIKSMIVLLFAGLLALLLRRASASIRHGVWSLGIIGALLLPLAAGVLPGLEIPVGIFSLKTPASTPYLQKPAFAHAIGLFPQEVIPAATLLWQFSPDEEASASRVAGFARGAWMLGCVFVLARFALGARAVRRLLRESTVTGSDSLGRLVNELRNELSMSEPVRLAYSDRGISPMTWGVFRHAIILPSHVTLWTEARQRAVLAHELAHVKRNDGMMQFLAQLLCGIYWFNPVAWYAARQVRIEREHACDDQVLRLGAKPEDYATHLVEIARGLAPKPQFSFAAGSIAEPSQLEKRLVSILDPRISRRSLSRLSTATLLCSISSIAVTLAVVRPAATAPSPTAPRVMASSLEIIEKPVAVPAPENRPGPIRPRGMQTTPKAVLTPPQLIVFSQPPYTPEAFENYIEGTVTLETTVDSEGNVTASRVVKGLGYGLDESALGAAPFWKFSPALKDGLPVGASMQISVEFKLANAAIRLAPGITPPKIVSRIQPQPTEEARAARTRGTVVLEAVIRLDGMAEIARVIQPLGYGLTESAIQALKQWTFEPGTKDGARLPISMNISVTFDWR